jgi:hypothetical protein
MNRCIKRSYAFTRQEVREVLVWWMKAKDLQAPQYIGDTDTTCWSMTDDGGVLVEWSADDQVDLESGKPVP